MAARASEAEGLFAFDAGCGPLVAGCDEAGRGGFAGPLMTAAVLFDERALGAEGRAALSALRDSKRLSPRARAARVAVASRSARRIDAVGLHRANLEANHSALAGVAYEGAVLLCDYYLLEDVGGQAPRPLVRGDSTSELVPSTSGTSRYPS